MEERRVWAFVEEPEGFVTACPVETDAAGNVQAFVVGFCLATSLDELKQRADVLARVDDLNAPRTFDVVWRRDAGVPE